VREVYDFLKKANTYYLATTEGDRPRVRPFGTIDLYDGKLYIQTGKAKPCYKQMAANPKIEICAFADGAWLRVEAIAVNDDSVEAKRHMLDAYPMLNDRYDAEDDNTAVLQIKNATATFESFTSEPKSVKFGW
jgi:uncharacterized pyridoxamine 5'-phosphate oxidase family protein